MNTDRLITGSLAVIAGVGSAIEVPPLAIPVLLLVAIALLAAIFGPDSLVRVLKWILIVVTGLLVLLLLLVVFGVWLVLHLLHLG